MTLAEAYRTLGVDPATAGRDSVTKRYRDLVKRLHPDVRPASEHDRATEDLQRVNEAFAAVRASDFPNFVPSPSAPPPGPRPGPRPQPSAAAGRGFSPPPAGPYGRPYGAGPASRTAAGFRTSVHAGRAPDIAFAQRYMNFDRAMGNSGPAYTIVMLVALLHLGHALSGFAPIAISFVAWRISRSARHAAWTAIAALWQPGQARLAGALNDRIVTASTTAILGFFAAFGLALYSIFR